MNLFELDIMVADAPDDREASEFYPRLFCFIGLGCQKLVFFLALVKLHNLRLRFADGVRVSQAAQTRRFRPLGNFVL